MFHEMQHFICNRSEADISTLQLIVSLKRPFLRFEYGQGGSKYKYRRLGAEILLSFAECKTLGEHWISQEY